MSGLIIIGASYAGVQAALSARESGYCENITIISDEGWLPYERPPLSKDFLLGKTSESNLILRDDAFFRKAGIELLLGHRAVQIDRHARRVETNEGAIVDFNKLVVATGSRARRMSVPGAELEGVCYLRSITDAINLKARLEDATDVVIVGGGFIGLEVGSSAVRLGKKVTVIESATRFLERAVCPLVSDFLDETHRQAGVDVRVREAVTSMEGENGRVVGVTLVTGEKLRADLVLVGVGGIANDSLAERAGMTSANGIAVNEYGQTDDPDIYAAGDCANHYNRFASGWIRLESVQHAQDQARAVGLAIAGCGEAYDAVPRFWSDQYDAKLQIVGLSSPHDHKVVRGSMGAGEFSVFYYRNGKLAAVASINRPGDQMASRRLIAAGASPSPDEAKDESFDLKSFAKAIDKARLHARSLEKRRAADELS